jgi:hypothetical protein
MGRRVTTSGLREEAGGSDDRPALGLLAAVAGVELEERDGGSDITSVVVRVHITVWCCDPDWMVNLWMSVCN